MSRLCIGFEVHQPYRLDPEFYRRSGDKATGSVYFSPLNRNILERVADKCYVPATEIILDSLDEGFKCAFSISGTGVEQLEKWRPEALGLFRQLARHRNAELLAQTYYHSLSSLFSDMGEFEYQVGLHKKLMKSVFSVTPKVMENTEFIFNNGIAGSAKRMGFKAIYTEGVERVLGWRSPDFVYSCQGLPVLMRNYMLSDDIAFRFNNREWDQYPLMADKFASWVAASPGDYVNVFVDYETFGEHHWAESGILEFLRWLPVECKNKGVELITPSEAAEIEPRDELNVEEAISWADVEKDTSAWLGNGMQQAAFKALRRARPYSRDKTMWRYLQTSDHFYYMSSKSGSCGEVHSYFSPDARRSYDTFDTYMSVLSDYESKAATGAEDANAAMVLRTVPPGEAFSFFISCEYTGLTAYSLDDLCELLSIAPLASIEYHMQRGDFSRWISGVLGDYELAAELSECKGQHELVKAACRRRDELWRLM